MKNYDVENCIRDLIKKGAIRIEGDRLDVTKMSNVGNKSLGKIDFLLSKGIYFCIKVKNHYVHYLRG